MRLTLSIVCLLVLAGCTGNRQQLNERIEVWKVKVATGVPLGADQSHVNSWAQQQGITFSYDRNENRYSALVEKLPGDGLVCAEWYILVGIKMDSQGKAWKHDVTSAGTCL